MDKNNFFITFIGTKKDSNSTELLHSCMRIFKGKHIQSTCCVQGTVRHPRGKWTKAALDEM